MLIEYKNATICQQDGEEVLKGVDFHADSGEFIYIIGRVGSGKSSLLKTFYQELDIEEADEATVLDYDMLSIRRKHVPALRRQMSIIFQDFQLLADRTVYKNLRFVLRATGWKKNEVDARIDEVLSQVGMTEKKMRMPHELSGGEQQRIAIARALLNSPKLIVADEPTGNLDPETTEGIMTLLKEISQTGTAVIMTTHNIPLLDRYPGTVYRCLDGRLEEVTDSYKLMPEPIAEEEGKEETIKFTESISFAESAEPISFAEPAGTAEPPAIPNEPIEPSAPIEPTAPTEPINPINPTEAAPIVPAAPAEPAASSEIIVDTEAES